MGQYQRETISKGYKIRLKQAVTPLHTLDAGTRRTQSQARDAAAPPQMCIAVGRCEARALFVQGFGPLRPAGVGKYVCVTSGIAGVD